MTILCSEKPLTNDQRYHDWWLKYYLTKLNDFVRKTDPQLALPEYAIFGIYDGFFPPRFETQEAPDDRT
jgi:hypothetical protein